MKYLEISPNKDIMVWVAKSKNNTIAPKKDELTLKIPSIKGVKVIYKMMAGLKGEEPSFYLSSSKMGVICGKCIICSSNSKIPLTEEKIKEVKKFLNQNWYK